MDKMAGVCHLGLPLGTLMFTMVLLAERPEYVHAYKYTPLFHAEASTQPKLFIVEPYRVSEVRAG